MLQARIFGQCNCRYDFRYGRYHVLPYSDSVTLSVQEVVYADYQCSLTVAMIMVCGTGVKLAPPSPRNWNRPRTLDVSCADGRRRHRGGSHPGRPGDAQADR